MKTHWHLTLTKAMALILCSCTLLATNAHAKPSIWQSIGYGHIIEVNSGSVTFFDVSEHHCLKNSARNAQPWAGAFKQLDSNNAQFDWHTVHPLKLTRLKKLPESCEKLKRNTDDAAFDPVAIFDVYWHTFARHYAFSGQQKWDWQ